MKASVNWSGEASHDVATALKAWLPNVIQVVDVFPVVAGTGPRARHG